MRETKILSGTSHPELSSLICDRIGQQLSPINIKRHNNGEFSVELCESVRNQDVFIIQSSSSCINDHLIELLIIINACKASSARKITAVIPFFPYSKQSKKKNNRSSITAKLIANMLSVSGVDHLITVDLHASQMQGFFNKPVDNLFGEPSIVKYIIDTIPNYKEAIVVSKNAGGVKRVTSLADKLGMDFAIIHSNQTEDKGEPVLVGNVKDRLVLLLDHMIDNSNSFIKAANHLKNDCLAKNIIIIAVHGIFSYNSLEMLERCDEIEKVVVTNSFPIPIEKRIASSKLVMIDLSGTLAEAIRRTHNGESISYLFSNPL